MNQQPKQVLFSTATCPACGLLCDDVSPQNIECKKGKKFFLQAIGDTQAKIKGKSVSLSEAVAKAADILSKAKQPLFAGLSTDIEGFRAIYQLAGKTNATLQHVNHASTQRNMRVLQNSGWQTTTLTEVKNRADLIVCIGTDIVSHNPRFFERFVDMEGMFVTQREVIYLGVENAPKGALALPSKADSLPEILAALHALVLGKSLKAETVAGLKMADLQTLADKLKAAKYAVLAWITKDLDFPHAELAIQQITQIVAALNQTTRASGLPLGGSDGDTSVNYAHTWLNGLIPDRNTGAHDSTLWINSFNAENLPPKSEVPTIVLGNTNSVFATAPDVFIPIATPGLDCRGTLFRVDGSVTLPLKKMRENALPTLAEVVRQIEVQLK